MRVCNSCGLFWRADFDVHIDHYENKEIETTLEKIEARKRNVKDRVRRLGRHTTYSNVCDVGCGEGLFLMELAEKGGSNLLGLEPGVAAARYGTSLGVRILPNTLQELENVAQETKGISTYTLFHVIEHLPDPIAALRIIKRILPENGLLVLETPDFSSDPYVKQNYMHKHVYPEHLYYWNPAALKLVLEREGFEVLESSHRDFDPSRINIREALRRLGILKYPVRSPEKPVVRGKSQVSLSNSKRKGLRTLVQIVISRILSLVIAVTGKGEYIWVVARQSRRV